MNHFLLPDGTQTPNEQASSFGANSMELLINALIKAGARRDRIRAKVFGGAEMYKGLTDAGARNSEFVLSYLQTEEIPLDGQSLGGSLARRIEFDPISGRARQKLVPDACIQEKVVVEVATNDLELF
ncbi:chemotaxis protein CheD [Pacificibacter maritimus]|nr:chemotaxis protein CheD [Pacificibacter maritimus]